MIARPHGSRMRALGRDHELITTSRLSLWSRSMSVQVFDRLRAYQEAAVDVTPVGAVLGEFRYQGCRQTTHHWGTCAVI